MAALERARDLVQQARHITVLTGAGISTASGISDYRGPQGRWTKDPDAELASTLHYFLTDPAIRAKAWQFRAQAEVWEAEPNPAHLALVELERQGRLTGIVTQNTDGLHLLAGSAPDLVHQMHGSCRTWRCEECGATGPTIDMVERVRAGDTDPRCPDCGGITRATTILFGEGLNPAVIDAALAAVDACDLLVVIGTSLRVHPVAGLVPRADARGVPIIIVNAEPTPYDDVAAVVVRESIAAAVPAICRVGEPSAH